MARIEVMYGDARDLTCLFLQGKQNVSLLPKEGLHSVFILEKGNDLDIWMGFGKQTHGFRQKVDSLPESIDEYDTIVLAYPNYWGTMPMAVVTFLEAFDFTGKTMKKEVMIVTGAGQIGMALARRTGFGKKIILGDKSMKNAEAIAEIMNNAGYDVVPFEMDLSYREDILAIIAKAQEYGEIKYLINAAGVSPSQAPIEAILKVDLYGTAVLLEEVGKVIAEGGAGVTISSQSGWRMPQLTPEEDRQLATTPTERCRRLHHRFYLPGGRRGNSKLLLRTATTMITV